MERRPKFLLDTHTFLWWVTSEHNLPNVVRALIEDGEYEVILSAVSCWEIVTKHKQGRLSIPRTLQESVGATAVRFGLGLLDVSFAHAQRTGLLPMYHKDPFDRLLISQAMEEDCVLLSRDRQFDVYGVERVWG